MNLEQDFNPSKFVWASEQICCQKCASGFPWCYRMGRLPDIKIKCNNQILMYILSTFFINITFIFTYFLLSFSQHRCFVMYSDQIKIGGSDLNFRLLPEAFYLLKRNPYLPAQNPSFLSLSSS